MSGKFDVPPPLPSQILSRLQRVAMFEGRTLLFISATFALLAAVSRDVTGAVAGCIAAGAGAMEIHGVNRLRAFDPSGVAHLVRSQLLLMATVLVYVTLRIMDPSHVTAIIATGVNNEMRERLAAQGVTEDQIPALLTQVYRASCVIVGIVTVFYQGGMAIYYHRRRDTVRRALEE